MSTFFAQFGGFVITLLFVALTLGSLVLLWWAHRTDGWYDRRTECWPERRNWWLLGAVGVGSLWTALVLGSRLDPHTWLWFFLASWTSVWLVISSLLTRTVRRAYPYAPPWHRFVRGVAVFASVGGVMTILATGWSLFLVAGVLALLPWIGERWYTWYDDRRRLGYSPTGPLTAGFLTILMVGFLIYQGGDRAYSGIVGTSVVKRVKVAVSPTPPKPGIKLPVWITGKGVWVVNLDHAEGGDLAEIVAKSKKYHVDHLLVKVFDSEWVDGPWLPYHGGDIQPPVKELIALAHAEGIRVYLWGYVYGKRPEREIKVVRECLMLGADGFIYDAEAECKKDGRAENLEEICAAVKEWRDKYRPNALLGFSSYDGTLVHANGGFPYQVFDRYTDVFIPQTYWKDDATGTPGDRLGWASEQWQVSARTYRAQGQGRSFDRILPAGHAYDPKLNSNLREIPYEEVVDFLERAKGFWGVSIYTYEYMGPEQWQGFRDGPGSLREKAERYGESLREERKSKKAEAARKRGKT